MAPSSPPVAAWELGLRLREARDTAGFGTTAAAKALGITQNYLSNIEQGRRRIAMDKLERLLDQYQVHGDERQIFLDLRRASTGTGWWSRYSGILSPELTRFISYEHGAREVRTYEGTVISGLLQTDGYSRALHASDRSNVRKSEIERRLEIRRRRQQRLFSPDAVNATILMNEGVLHQQVGGAETLVQQLEYLLNLMDHFSGTLDIRIIPFAAGGYGALGSSTFHLLTFPSARLVRIGWYETVTSHNLIQDESTIHQYDMAFNEALGCAADHDGSRTLIQQAIGSLA